MMQERLDGLLLIAVERKILKTINCAQLIVFKIFLSTAINSSPSSLSCIMMQLLMNSLAARCCNMQHCTELNTIALICCLQKVLHVHVNATKRETGGGGGGGGGGGATGIT